MERVIEGYDSHLANPFEFQFIQCQLFGTYLLCRKAMTLITIESGAEEKERD